MKVTLYYDLHCFDCVIAKTYLEANNIDFEAKDLEIEENKLELIEKIHKYIAPVIIIDDEVFIGFGSIDGKFISNAPLILGRLGILPVPEDKDGNPLLVAPAIIKKLGIVE